MSLLLCAATRFEIQPAIDWLQAHAMPTSLEDVFVLGNVRVRLCITGVGIMSATYSIATELHMHDYSLIVQAGIAGAYKRELALGDVVLVTEDRLGDIGAEDGKDFLHVDELGFGDESTGLLRSMYDTDAMPILAQLPQAKAVTVHTTAGRKRTVKLRAEKYAPDIESMEGAALHFVCKKEGVDCLQLRSISNYAERRNRDAWNIPLAVTNLNEVVIRLLAEGIQ